MSGITVKVSNRNQIALPSAARKQLNIKPGDRLLVDIQDGMLVLMPQPANMVQYLAGLEKSVWEDTNSGVYLNEERASWHISKK